MINLPPTSYRTMLATNFEPEFVTMLHFHFSLPPAGPCCEDGVISKDTLGNKNILNWDSGNQY